MNTDGFNRLPRDSAESWLLDCCASRAWAGVVAAGRPYADRGSLLASASTEVHALDWPEVEEALRAHPPLGGQLEAGTPSAMARAEQAGLAGAGAAATLALAESNRSYESRFGYVFLTCADQRDAPDILAEMKQRMNN
ncbi:MAG TPA: 2-oxo-4-hydroxy-4-carboxy-5-ureidoimidazoline decarboxylase, partial [Streptosporangiaceae bacterium]|nr:2-oxo-4-hydroxy-4-carboxy-5-ureidoimidazoline decarboxylase [Streptosporangiaceae bacterium]